MLTIRDSRRQFGRREVLRLGSLAFGSLALPGLPPLWRDAAAATPSLPVTGKSVIFLFLHGGPSQFETFDPKMSAPSTIHSATGEIPTSLPGVTFGGTFPKLASLAHRMAVVRSYVPGDANHDIKPIVCRDTAGANLGSLYGRVVGANHPVTGMPTNMALFPQAVDSEASPAQNQFGRFDSTGTLGSGYAPFIPGAEGPAQKNMELRLPADRLTDRRSLLSNLDQSRWSLDQAAALGALDDLRSQAFSTILGGVSRAFDLGQEDPAVVARYDTAPLVRPEQISRRWNNYKFYVDNARSLGKLLLLARRRLCEGGCGFVTVTTNFVWDMHADSNNAGCEEGMQYMGPPLDHAVSAFLEDVHARGLSDKILLVACGEIGRTPRLENNAGRNHWGQLGPLFLAGGGYPMGQVIGQSSADGGTPATEPVTIRNVIGTIFHTLFDVGQLRLLRGLPPEVLKAAEHEPIPGLG